MSFEKLCFFFLILGFSLCFSGCAENLPQDIPKAYNAPEDYTFNASYDKAWKSVVRAISVDSRIKTLDKSSGLIVTDYMTVNKEILTMFETAFFGRTYKNSYSVTLFEESRGKTNIRVRSNLLMEQFAVYERERKVTWFEAYMRQDLFKKICMILYNDRQRCEALFPGYTNTPQQSENDAIDSDIYIDPPVETYAQQHPTHTSKSMILNAQKALQEAGYEPGTIDGVMGQKTRTAIQAFQKDKHLGNSGLLDDPTIIALGL